MLLPTVCNNILHCVLACNDVGNYSFANIIIKSIEHVCRWYNILFYLVTSDHLVHACMLLGTNNSARQPSHTSTSHTTKHTQKGQPKTTARVRCTTAPLMPQLASRQASELQHCVFAMLQHLEVDVHELLALLVHELLPYCCALDVTWRGTQTSQQQHVVFALWQHL